MCWGGDKPTLSECVTTARRFVLVRHTDFGGVSGTGIVADGCEFPNGKVAVAWRGKRPSVAIYDSMLAVEDVHGHKGATEVRFVDDWREMTRTALAEAAP